MHTADHITGIRARATADVIVLAAGTGERLGMGPKALVCLAGRPLLWWALESVLTNACVRDIIVVANPQAVEETVAVSRQSGDPGRIRVVTGGVTRSESSSQGLAALRQGTEYVAVTDGVRPLVPPGTIDRLSARLASAGVTGISGVVPAIPVFETVRRARSDGLSLGTVNRDELRAVQTPELFCRMCLETAMAFTPDPATMFTDEAGLIEHHGGKVLITPGDPVNRKITVEADLPIAEATLAMAYPAGMPGMWSVPRRNRIDPAAEEGIANND